MNKNSKTNSQIQSTQKGNQNLIKLEICPFNKNHKMKKENLNAHIKICPNKPETQEDIENKKAKEEILKFIKEKNNPNIVKYISLVLKKIKFN